MKLADRGLNTQAQAIEEAQTRIRIAVRDGWFGRNTKAEINSAVQKIISAALKGITVAALKDAAYRSLNAFAERQYATYMRSFGSNPTLLLALLALTGESLSKVRPQNADKTVRESLTYVTEAKGSPTQVYAKEYLEKHVAPVITQLCRQNALDPDDIDSRNSMRNRAEMEVRYDAHLSQISDLKEAGVKLVVSSVHADCSDRCYPYQGRVYSLDGTSGTTSDGKAYQPLENATDIYYTTKAGKTYKNGLLGFNCRHSLMPYKEGMIIPHVDKKTQQRERDINAKQRELETIVRKWETEAVMNKGINEKLHSNAKHQARMWRKEYMKFSRDNGRAYYPSRIDLL